MPQHRICLEMVRALGNPLLTTSATLPDKMMLHDPSLIQDHFGSRIDMVINGGPVPGEPSSVISLIDDMPEVMRRGLGNVEIFE